ncbi:MAG: cell division protein FtsQ/DivIB, partial [Thermoleophilaceae bacterium]
PRLARPSLPALSPRLRRRLLAVVAACALLGACYQLWLRDSSLVGVREVTVTGLSTSDAERVRAALTAAGRTMTTLHVDHEALERAVAGYSAVHELEVSTDFPHGLRVHVVEHVPAAIAVGEAGKVPVAGDGTILRGLPVEGRLPTVETGSGFGPDRLRGRAALAATAVAGAAPAALRGRIAEVGDSGHRGLVAEMRDGPELVFGDASRLAAKWAAAARVLADLEASGASYIDLRIPGRPAAGGLPAQTVTPVAPAGETSTTPPAGDPAAAPLADPAAVPLADPAAAPLADPAAAPLADPTAGPLADPTATSLAEPAEPPLTTPEAPPTNPQPEIEVIP